MFTYGDGAAYQEQTPNQADADDFLLRLSLEPISRIKNNNVTLYESSG